MTEEVFDLKKEIVPLRDIRFAGQCGSVCTLIDSMGYIPTEYLEIFENMRESAHVLRDNANNDVVSKYVLVKRDSE